MKKLKKIYTKDSTINWIFRIAESKICKENENEFQKYLDKCYDGDSNNDNTSKQTNFINKYATSKNSGFIIYPHFPNDEPREW